MLAEHTLDGSTTLVDQVKITRWGQFLGKTDEGGLDIQLHFIQTGTISPCDKAWCKEKSLGAYCKKISLSCHIRWTGGCTWPWSVEQENMI